MKTTVLFAFLLFDPFCRFACAYCSVPSHRSVLIPRFGTLALRLSLGPPYLAYYTDRSTRPVGFAFGVRPIPLVFVSFFGPTHWVDFTARPVPYSLLNYIPSHLFDLRLMRGPSHCLALFLNPGNGSRLFVDLSHWLTLVARTIPLPYGSRILLDPSPLGCNHCCILLARDCCLGPSRSLA